MPELPLRRGTLNQTAYSLFLFVRDVCDGDLAGWLDHRLGAVPTFEPATYGQRLADAVCEPMSRIYGASRKVVHMALSDLMLASSGGKPLWREACANMIAIDTLVHNLLNRTGVLRARNATHPYGPACYRSGGCAEIVREISASIDAGVFDTRFPSSFPRLIQHALWRFCAQQELDICNGNRVDERGPCVASWCPAFAQCDHARERLKPPGLSES